MDISKSEHTSANIFKAIMDNGAPLTLYHANSKTKIPIGTIHRHFKILSQIGKIRVYESKRKGRKKIEYGPTMYGMISFYKQNKRFAERIENYFLIWIENREFREELAAEGYDVTEESLKKSKHIFRKYMDYFSAIEEQIDRIRRGEDTVSHDIQIVLGSVMLSSDPHYQKLWTDLYNELPGMQKSLDEYMDTMIKSYLEFKRKTKRHLQKTRQALQEK